jgi:hypothetical protein
VHFTDVGAALARFNTEARAYIDPKGTVAKILDDLISQKASGQALLRAIKNTADIHAVHITPDLVFSLTGTPSADADLNDAVTALNVTYVGMPILEPGREKPWQGVRDDRGNFLGGGLGTRIDPQTGRQIHGDDVFVDFSPEAFARGSPSRPPGPGMEPDEVLFHELVHAVRQLAGVVYFMPVNRNYDNEEEYLAITISNIYIRNKDKRAPLRGDHDQGVLQDPDHFLDNVQGVDPAPRMLLERFKLVQQDFFNDLAKIDSSVTGFSPVWQYNNELTTGRARGGQLINPP